MESQSRRSSLVAWLFIPAVLCLPALGMAGCASTSPDYQNQRAFKSPESAVDALVAAAAIADTNELDAIFGPAGHDVLSSGDPVADQNNREVFLVAMSDGWTLQAKDTRTKELIVGAEQWPFPIPLAMDSHGWWFDTVAGRQEVLARRIGRNELATIGVLQTYVIAQNEYASEGHDGKSDGIYAQKVKSDPGMHNGLYWPMEHPDDPPSPLGNLAAEASAEGYSTDPNVSMRPFHGYYYRILTRQGDAAPGGAMDYVVNGEMTAGFAAIAYPAVYMNSGVMTFLVGPDGIVYQTDLGEDTLQIASKIDSYNPDSNWTVVE